MAAAAVTDAPGADTLNELRARLDELIEAIRTAPEVFWRTNPECIRREAIGAAFEAEAAIWHLEPMTARQFVDTVRERAAGEVDSDGVLDL